MSKIGLEKSRSKMRDANVSTSAIEVFAHYYQQLSEGEDGLVSESEIRPLEHVSSLSDQQFDHAQQSEAVNETVVIKLNGGLGTSMGLDQAKTLLPVRDGLNFLDLIVRQVLDAREEFESSVPLIFMNSYRTDRDTLEYLERYPDLPVDDLPLSFIQSQEPRLLVENLLPLELPNNREEEWCPPGHGDIYVALQSSGLLDSLLDKGFKYAQISNGDNLGATLDGTLAAWFASSGAPFAMEVSRRTENDRKGGHLAVRKSDSTLLLRESAQTSEEDAQFFEDIDRHRFFNTNTIWLNLESLKSLLDNGPVLGLPMIRNVKTVQTDDGLVDVVQVETAMGAAIEVFEGATAIEVPRSRFLPVKTTNELMLLRSDVYRLDQGSQLVQASPSVPKVSLAPAYYQTVRDFDERVSNVPSLKDASLLEVKGDWYFSAGSAVIGDVVLGPEGGVFDA